MNIQRNIQKINNNDTFVHYLITRFSVNFGGMNTKNVFEPKRLDEHIELFVRMCYPSVVNQTNKNFTWLIVIDRNLPMPYQNKLANIIKDSPVKIKVVMWNNKYQFGQLNWIPMDKIRKYIITTRIDDDDAIHPQLIEMIQKYYYTIQIKHCKFITFQKGLQFFANNGVFKELIRPMIAIGLTLISNINTFPYNIHQFDHMKITNKQHVFDNSNRNIIEENNYVVTLLQNIYMWIYTIHEKSDSGYMITNRDGMSKKKINVEINKNKNDIIKKFNIIL